MTHLRPCKSPVLAVIGGVAVLSVIACTPRGASAAAPAPSTAAAARAVPTATDPLAHALTGHPRLFADARRFAEITASTTPAVRDALQAIAQEADFLREKPLLERKVDGFRLLAVSRDALLRIGTLAADYRLRGDPAAGQAAKRQLLAVAPFQRLEPRPLPGRGRDDLGGGDRLRLVL
jgi:hypothetical protein